MTEEMTLRERAVKENTMTEERASDEDRRAGEVSATVASA
jgi:hypothetical protein